MTAPNVKRGDGRIMMRILASERLNAMAEYYDRSGQRYDWSEMNVKWGLKKNGSYNPYEQWDGRFR